MRLLAGVMVAVLCLCGCAERTVWDRPGATQQDFNADAYACEKDMRQSGYFGTGFVGATNAQNFYDRCMMARGWNKREAGSSTAGYDAAKRASDECEARGIKNGYPLTPQAKAFADCYDPLYEKYSRGAR